MGDEDSCFQDTAEGAIASLALDYTKVEKSAILPYDVKDTTENVKGILGHFSEL